MMPTQRVFRATVLLLIGSTVVGGFILQDSTRARTPLFAKGMGMAKPTKKAKKTTPFNVSASLLKLEKVYDKLLLAQAKAIANDQDQTVWEYVVAVRARAKDWVPIAQLGLESPDEPLENLRNQAVSTVCREISALAVSGSKQFQAVPRDQIEYSLEPTDSFYKYVYEPLLEGKKENLSKAEAREILGVASDEVDMPIIKSAYRKLSMEWHPDRHEEDKEEANLMFHRIRDAYETLHTSSNSWYESLGGKERMEFQPVELTPLSQLKHSISCGLVALDPELVQTFAARSLSSSR